MFRRFIHRRNSLYFYIYIDMHDELYIEIFGWFIKKNLKQYPRICLLVYSPKTNKNQFKATNTFCENKIPSWKSTCNGSDLNVDSSRCGQLRGLWLRRCNPCCWPLRRGVWPCWTSWWCCFCSEKMPRVFLLGVFSCFLWGNKCGFHNIFFFALD